MTMAVRPYLPRAVITAPCPPPCCKPIITKCCETGIGVSQHMRGMDGKGEQDAGETVALRIEIAGRPLGHPRRRLRVVAHRSGRRVDGRTRRSALRRARRLAVALGAEGAIAGAGRPDERLAGQRASGLSAPLYCDGGRGVRRLVAGLFVENAFDPVAQGAAAFGAVRRRFRGAILSDGRGSGRIHGYCRRAVRSHLSGALDAGRAAHGRGRHRGRRCGSGKDNIRAFLLFAGGRAIAYLYLPVERDILVYAHLGYDPDFAELSPGTVLHVEAMRMLYDEGRFRAFDFTEGDGAHKAQFGRASVACADVLILRPVLRNRAALAAMRGVDGLAAHARALLDRLGMRAKVKALIRR